MPFELHEIATGLAELEEARVITIEGETLYQRRMVKDGEISEKRSNSGTLGGRPATAKNEIESKTKSKSESTLKAKTEIENVYENNIIDSEEEKGVQGKRKPTSKPRFTPPTLEEVMEYAQERGNKIDPIVFFDYYEANGWVQGKQGKPLKDWKAAARYWERNGVITTKSSNGRQQATGAAAQGGFSEVCGDTPAKKTRHTSL